jgi:hypothetical protein
MEGVVRRVSMSTALTQAGSFRDISHASPLVIVAIHRIALASSSESSALRLEDRARWGQSSRFRPKR